MIDCYRILGITRQASPVEIRAAYLAKMKQLHPDLHGAEAGGSGDAAEISHAYWQLRDAGRRADHDRLLDEIAARPGRRPARVSLRKAGARAARHKSPVQPTSGPARPRAPSRRARGRRLQPMRAAAGVAACSLATIAFALATTAFSPATEPREQAAGLIDASQAVARATPHDRRRVDPALADAAALEFRQIVARGGLDDAHQYARQCLMELASRPTMTLLDYCVAFDDEAAAWETQAAGGAPRGRRFFGEDQRYGRYASVARGLAPGRVRDSIMADVGYFSESGF